MYTFPFKKEVGCLTVIWSGQNKDPYKNAAGPHSCTVNEGLWPTNRLVHLSGNFDGASSIVLLHILSNRWDALPRVMMAIHRSHIPYVGILMSASKSTFFFRKLDFGRDEMVE